WRVDISVLGYSRSARELRQPSMGARMSSATASEAPSFAEQAYEIIRDRLVMLEIRPGSPINDDQLGRELGLGRTPVREALKHLERERLVVVYPRRGTFATEINITDL